MKKIIFTIILILLATSISACGNDTVLSQDEATVSLQDIYPRTMTVTEINTESDIITLADSVGHIWEFYGIEDWEVGDICSCIMHTNGTEIITDDEIISTRYNGRGGN